MQNKPFSLDLLISQIEQEMLRGRNKKEKVSQSQRKQISLTTKTNEYILSQKNVALMYDNNKSTIQSTPSKKLINLSPRRNKNIDVNPYDSLNRDSSLCSTLASTIANKTKTRRVNSALATKKFRTLNSSLLTMREDDSSLQTPELSQIQSNSTILISE